MTVVRVGGPIDEIGVCFAVYGEELDPDRVTALLGCPPTSSHRRGEQRGPRNPPFMKGAWLLAVRGRAPRQVEELTVELMDRLPRDEKMLQRVRDVYEVQLRIALHLGGFNEGFELSPGVVEKIAKLRVPVLFDIYADAEEPSSGERST
jgi:hypothetical protein